jgi:hypothetical protein
MKTAASDAAQKNGWHAEAPSQGKSDMLNIAEKAPKASLLSKVGSEFVMASPEKKAAEWLDEQIAKSQDKVTTIVADLTPALATALLNRNESNRKINLLLVDSYARDMTNAAWLLNGEPLIVAKNGQMNDGQHRCQAVIQAQHTVPVVFVFGVDRDTRTTVDQGKVRTAADFLSMNGHSNVSPLAAGAGHIWQHIHNGYLSSTSRDRPNKGEILTIIEQHPSIIKSIGKAAIPAARAVGGPAMLGFCHWTFARAGAGPKVADVFIEALTGGASLGRRSPILYVRNRLMSERGRLRANDKAELIFKAWNTWRRDEEVRQFTLVGGLLPKVEK